MASLKKILKKKKYEKIKLNQIATNHLELKVKINGIKGSFILDTGASNSCVDLSLDDRFKLLTEDSEIKAAGAGATDMETKLSKGNIINIGTWKSIDCNLVLFDLTHVNTALTNHNAEEVQGIVGADILEEGKAIIDYSKKELYLKKVKNKNKLKVIKGIKF